MSDLEPRSGWCAEPDLPLLALDDEGEPEPESSFERVYLDNHAFVWRCARRMGVATADLDDVLQDTFVTAYRRFDRWDRRSRASTWLFGILRNVLRNRARAQRRHERRVAALAEHSASPSATNGERVLAGQLLRGFLATLDPDKRAVFELAELEGLTAGEIGDALAISPNTASSRLRLAREAFDRHFDHATRKRVTRATTRERERPEQPPAAAAERTLALVLATPGTSALVGGSGLLGSLGLGKLAFAASLAITASLASLAMVGIGSLASPERAGETGQAAARSIAGAPRASEPKPLESSPADPTLAEPTLDELAIPVVALLDPSSSRTPARPHESALLDYEALRTAREQLLANAPALALQTLDSAPGDALDEARAATRIAALCQLARADEARATWSALQDRHAASGMVERLRDACWSSP